MADGSTSTLEELLRSRRKARGLTQAQLAATIGCATITISRLERGHIKRHVPRHDLTCALAAELNIDQATLSALICAALK